MKRGRAAFASGRNPEIQPFERSVAAGPLTAVPNQDPSPAGPGVARPLRILGPVLKNILIAMAALVACAPGAQDTAPCTIATNARELHSDILETSGLALSRRTPGVLWTHNDSGNEPFLYALDSTGTIMGHVRVSGAALIDWEDMAAGPCNAGTCLFIADIGDNPGRRDSISIYVVPEPLPDRFDHRPRHRLPRALPRPRPGRRSDLRPPLRRSLRRHEGAEGLDRTLSLREGRPAARACSHARAGSRPLAAALEQHQSRHRRLGESRR